MRLINVKTLALEEISSTRLPTPAIRYGILSHRWDDEEVSFGDICDIQTMEKERRFRKIVNFCRVVQEASWDWKPDYVWVDTCCIDKRSSAELSEAINSMYQWYAEAVRCYAYLSDVENVTELHKSVWFTRSWTLQELIASPSVHFYNKNWKHLGTRLSLASTVAQATGIEEDTLEGRLPLSTYSIAQRMSWASKRVATRPEDIAYSLMGLFKVNMPMLYGKGEQAFARLQEEIVRHSDDHSIFAWTYSRDPNDRFREPRSSGLFASSPMSFQTCGSIIKTQPLFDSEGFSVTNVGLSIKLPMIPWGMGLYCAVLNCSLAGANDHHLAIFLRQLPQRRQYARVEYKDADGFLKSEILIHKSIIDKIPEQLRQSRVLVRRDARASNKNLALYGFWIQTLEPPQGLRILKFRRRPRGGTYVANRKRLHHECARIPSGSHGTACSITFEHNNQSRLTMMKLGFDQDFAPVVFLAWHRSKSSPCEETSLLSDARWINRACAYAEIQYSLRSDIGQIDAMRTNSCVIRVDSTQGFLEVLGWLGVSLEISWGTVNDHQEGWVVAVRPHHANGGEGRIQYRRNLTMR